MTTHICQTAYRSLPGMREFYAANNMLATSEHADVALIRSAIAYHCGNDRAERAVIKASRGHSYSVTINGLKSIVRIADHYNHRSGVTGLGS